MYYKLRSVASKIRQFALAKCLFSVRHAIRTEKIKLSAAIVILRSLYYIEEPRKIRRLQLENVYSPLAARRAEKISIAQQFFLFIIIKSTQKNLNIK